MAVHEGQGLAGRRHAAGVEHMQLAILGGVDDDEEIARQADIHRFDKVQHRGGRHCRVHRIAAAAQNLQTRFRRQRLAGGHHAIAGHGLGAALRHPAFGAVAAHRFAEG